MASQTDTKRGDVRGEPVRYVKGHANKRAYKPDYEVRDEGHDTPCWVWLKTRHGDGYGALYDGNRQHRAHRWYYEKYVGSIPRGLTIDHLCGNRLCVNPEHLEAVTRSLNTLRWHGKTERVDFAGIVAAEGSLQEIADEFGVSRSYVQTIRSIAKELVA